MGVDHVDVGAIDGVELVAVAGIGGARDVDFGASRRGFDVRGERDVGGWPVHKVHQVDAEGAWVGVDG